MAGQKQPKFERNIEKQALEKLRLARVNNLHNRVSRGESTSLSAAQLGGKEAGRGRGGERGRRGGVGSKREGGEEGRVSSLLSPG